MTCLHKGGKQAMLKGGCKAGFAGCYLCKADQAELNRCHSCLFTQANVRTDTHTSMQWQDFEQQWHTERHSKSPG
jgi:hypothetical protein